MSRFLGKSVIPISLMKEKENKAATATRSASCSIGKWGNYKFTSTRYHQSLIAQTNEDINNDSNIDRDRSVSPPAEPVKPKKFFKSRNNTQARVLIIPASDVSSSTFDTTTNYHHNISSSTMTTTAAAAASSSSSLSLSTTVATNKKQTSSSSSNSNLINTHQNYLHIENGSSSKNEEMNVRQRVNMNSTAVASRKVKKEREREKEKQLKGAKEQQIVEQPPKVQGTRCSSRPKKIVNYNLEEDSIFSRSCSSSTKDKKEISSSTANTNETVVSIPSAPAPLSAPQADSVVVDHPPIVLRISKGTSQLLNTDNCPTSTATPTEEAEPYKPLKKEPNYSELNYCTVKISPDKPPKERLKLIIKTADLTAQICHEPAQPVDHISDDNNSRSLISPSFISDKDFDSQSSVIGSNSSKFTVNSKFPVASDVTSDLDTSQHSSLVAAPSDIETRLESMMEIADESNDKKFEEPLKDDILSVLTGGEERCISPPITLPVTSSNIESTFEIQTRRSTRNKTKDANKVSSSGILSPPSGGRICSPTTTTVVAPPLKSPLENDTKKRSSSRLLKISEPVVQQEQIRIKSPKTYNRKKRKTSNLIVEDVEVEQSEKTPPLRIVPIKKIKKSKIIDEDFSQTHELEVQHKEEVGSVKLVISKKKGSIYKSRTEEAVTKKKHMYKHTWDVDDDNNSKKFRNNESNENEVKKAKVNALYDDFNTSEEEITSSVHNQISSTSSYSMNKSSHSELKIKNVKTAHQIQEIGEFQEMDDDIEYILDALQSHNQIPTRCLSALQLASKCMTPGFRMHVRAHGTVTKFFRALHDSKNDLSLGLCTSTIMYALSQDALNMDLDRDSLELMLNLLEVNSTMSLSSEQMSYFEKTKSKVREICEEIKNQGRGEHLNLETISVGTLAMETLLSLTSKRAGTWFIEDLRELGGIEHIVKTICECCLEISEYVVSWTEHLLTKLKTIERCLRVLENVTQGNEKNQSYIINYNQGEFLDVLFKLFKMCDAEMSIHPTTATAAKDSPGVILRETLIPILKVLINLTHTMSISDKTTGSCIFGQKTGLFDICFHILLQASNYVPEKCLFEFNLLVLLLLINLTMYVEENRTRIMNLIIKSSSGTAMSAIESLVTFFYKCVDMANVVEQNTDEILDNTANNKKKDELDETVNNLLRTAGHHMEYTMKASYTGIVIGNLIKSNNYEQLIRKFLRDNKFNDMVVILEKYYNFMNYTASSEATVVAHMKSTKDIIEHFKEIDVEDIP